MDAGALAVVKSLERAEEAVWQALEHACMAYAGGSLRAKPLVDRHFTAGNEARYGFEPLSRDYFLAKQRGIVSHRGASHHLSASERRHVRKLKAKHARSLKSFKSPKGASPERQADDAAFRRAQGDENRAELKGFLDKLLFDRQGSKLDDKAGFKSSTGTMTGFGSGRNLPMLVLTGRLRQAVSGKRATIRIDRGSGVATITFGDLPEYALYLHDGTARMPARSPVEPCAADLEQMRALAQQFMDDASGKLRQNPVRGGTATMRR